MTLGRYCGLVAAAFLMLSVLAVADPSPPSKRPPTPLKLEPAKPVELTCKSKSVVVSTNAANATNGTLTLTLVLKDISAKPATGAWRIASVDPAHTGSLGQREAKTCAETCPLTLAADGNVELWSPAPKAIDKLAEGEWLLLAVVKAATLDLRATTFSGKQIESLEEGTCRIGS
jgi:hypothetical protein